jgi:hypothetical protein
MVLVLDETKMPGAVGLAVYWAEFDYLLNYNWAEHLSALPRSRAQIFSVRSSYEDVRP